MLSIAGFVLRPEAVGSGAVKLVGTDAKRIKEAVSSLMESSSVYGEMAWAANPYGDGTACQQIINIIKKTLL